tara:strand:- start:695 stop:2320 length:1626 start_codon:yes stop_codon:yes gene_type:complete
MSNVKVSILNSNRMTKNYRYEVNGHIIIDTVDLDTNNGNFGRIIGTTELVTGAGGFITKPKPIDPGSELAKAIAEDKTGDRNNTYQKVMTNVKNNAAKQGKLSLYNEALSQSGMSAVANGNAQIDAPVVSNQGVDKSVNEEKNEDIEPKEKKRSNASLDYYKYPKDMHLDQDYMYIEKFEYKPPQAAYLSENVLTGKRYRGPLHREGMMGWLPGANGALGILDPDVWRAMTGKHEIINEYETIEGKKPMSVLNEGLGKGSNLGADKKLMGSVKLPIPNGLSVSQGVNWGEGRVNALEAGAFLGVQNQMSQLIAGQKNLAGVFGAGVQGMMDGLAQLKQVGTGGSNQILSSLLAKNTLAQLGINVDSSQMIARSTGTAINPNLELLFSGPKLRTFQFVFNFAPNEADEAQEVRGIMRMFREGMLPHNASTGDKLFLGAPDVFRLSYKNKTKRIKSLNIFKICALTACEINFTPDNQYQSYEDVAAVSMPVRSTMKLTFTELSPIFADDYTYKPGDGKPNPSVDDLDTLVTGENEITDHDIGF